MRVSEIEGYLRLAVELSKRIWAEVAADAVGTSTVYRFLPHEHAP